MEQVNESTPHACGADNVIGGLHWSRMQYERMCKIAIVLGIVVFATTTIVCLLALNLPEPRYFATTQDMRVAPLVPLDKPVLSQQGLLNWTAETISQSISLDFLEWREKLSRTRDNFDDAAYKSFLSSLNSSGVLEMIKDKRLSVSAVITRAPVVVSSGVVSGKATWKIEFPLVVSYESSQGVESTQHLMATVLVRRASTTTTPRGVLISQVVLKRGE